MAAQNDDPLQRIIQAGESIQCSFRYGPGNALHLTLLATTVRGEEALNRIRRAVPKTDGRFHRGETVTAPTGGTGTRFVELVFPNRTLS